MKPVANLVIEMAANVARLEKDMQSARRSVDGAMQKIQRSAQMAMRALGALGLGLGAAQLTSFVKKAIDAGDRMQKLSQQTGIATQNIAGLQLAFRQGGGTAADMEMAVNRLVIGMNKQTDSFKKLNIQSTDTFGALSEISDIFQKLPDGAEKSALANELFGRSGSRLIPILNQGAAGLQSYIELSQKLGTSVTPEVAKQFEKYNDTMDTVSAAMEGLAMQAATALVPALQAVADALINLFESGAVKRGIDGLVTAFQLLAVVMATKVVIGVAGVIGGIASMAAGMTVATGATAGLTVAMTALKGVMAFLGGPVGVVVTVAAALVYFTEKSYDAANSAEALATELGIANGELETMKNAQIEGKLVDIAIELNDLAIAASEAAAELDNLNNQMLDPEAYLIQGGQNSSALAKINRQIEIRQELLEKLKGQLVQNTQAEVRLNEITVTATEGKASNISALRELIAAYEFQTDAMTMTNAEKETAIFLQKVENEGVREGSKLYAELTAAKQAAISRRQEVEASIAQREAEKKLADDRLAIRVEAEEQFQREAEMINNQIGQSLTDALMNGGMKAKDLLINLFKTLVLRPILQPIISGVLGAVGVGAAGAAFAGGGEASSLAQATGLMGVVSAVKGAVDMVTGGFSSVGAMAGNLTASLTSSALAVEGVTGSLAINAALIESGTIGLTGATMETAALSVSQLSSAAAAAGTVLAGVAAGLTVGTLISGQFKVGGDQMIATGIGTAIGTGIGLAVGGPIGGAIGAAIGGAVGGLVNRAFGMGPKELFRSGVALDIGAGGLADTSFAFRDTQQRGGLFRSDKEARQRFGVDGELAAFFNQSAMAIASSVRSMTESFGLSTDEINNIQIHGVVETFNKTEEEITAQVDQILFDLQESLIRGLIPNIDAFARATDTSVGGVLQRLSASLSVVNSTFDVLGFSLYDLTLAGGDAASKMIELVGGIEAFTAATSFYYENFYSAEERANKQLEQMTELFTTMGMVLPDSRDAFRALVESAQAAGNQALVASLLQIAPSFISMKTALEELGLSVDNVSQDILKSLTDNHAQAMRDTDQAFDRLRVSLAAQLDATLQSAQRDLDQTLALIASQREAAGVAREVASESLNAIKSVFDLLTNEINDLGSSVLATQTSAQARLFITQALQTAQTTGYLPTSADLGRAIGQARGGMGSEQFATAFEQQRDNLRLRNELIALQGISGEQLTEAQRQLFIAQDTLDSLDRQAQQAQDYYQRVVEQAQSHHDQQLQAAQDQIDTLREVDNSVLGVADAMTRLASAISSEMGARSAMQVAQSAAASVGGATVNRPTLSKNDEITAMYQDILGRAPDAAGFAYWSTHPSPIDQIREGIASSAEAKLVRGFADGGYYPGGMAMVGERGPELIDFSSPGMVYNNERLRSAMGGGDTAAELRALREDNRIQSRAMVSMQSRMAKVIEQWNGDGLPSERFEGATA